ncbi:DUF2512 family protein [Peribacillus kribbensis]|uniref:DUF2512 family protein n=1 Tax=Peribacillus kribbensis TaxID=356658 RepID=UPI0003F6C894|nr:DUF2512 family protein [Peribacillus kribbensis]
MRAVFILLMKFIVSLAAFYIGLDLFFDASVADIASFSAAAALLTYVLGDMIAIPRLGRSQALVIDFTLVYLSVWIFGSILLDDYGQIGWGSILSAGVFTLAEAVLHRFAFRDPEAGMNGTKTRTINPKLAYSTEMAEEPAGKDK